MKYVLLVAALSASLCAEEPKISKEIAKKIFIESVVNAKDVQEAIPECVDGILSMSPTSLSREELIRLVFTELQNNEDDSIERITNAISVKELDGVLGLLNNPLYLKYRKVLGNITGECVGLAAQKVYVQAAGHPLAAVSTEIIHPIQEITHANYTDFIAAHKYTIVDIFSDECPPCRMLAPILQQVSNLHGGSYTFAKINYTKENEELLSSMKLKGVPTILLYKDGKEIGRRAGYADKETLEAFITKTFTQ